ncbi:MAG: Alpha-glucuronidase [candidate division NC10 bacterium]|nr:Alpha-glucuronidase [candidate division NC10 bacterium]
MLLAIPVMAETGYDAWLRYAPIDDPVIRARYGSMPATVVALGDSVVIQAARAELIRGLRGMLGRTLRVEARLPKESAFILGTVASVKAAVPGIGPVPELIEDGYWLKSTPVNGAPALVITAPNDRGVVYGVFALLRKVGLAESISVLDEKQIPYAPVRWVNEWNNLDGSIERGYGGLSIFFEKDNVRADLSRVRDYARLLASLGVNGCTINNVNANTRVITTEFLPQVARIAEVFRPWGIRLSVAVDFSSPRSIGGLDTFDPLDPRVIQWWKDKFDEIYRVIPDFGGVVVKADSEGRVGPSAYGRTHADATNVIARALKPHGGLIFYRGFVYDHKMDWRILKNDRARAADDNFRPLDGKFEDNALIQIKNGPIDFQVREPASPLFGTLEKTNQAVELQITQEYLGQARHLVYLVPMWKATLDFDLQAKGPGTPVKALVAGKTFGRPTGGFVGVSNVGLDQTWAGQHLGMANLYGFGRLAWNPDLSARQIAEEWTRLTFNQDKRIVDTIVTMQLNSWRTYENYSGPLGAQTLTDITGAHYGPAVEASERNGWGQWHRADEKGIGMDRTVATGTGFIGQFRPPVAKVYESLKDCPDELLLWMHHVPYTYVLHSGKTVIQHIYDTHYQGLQEAEAFVTQWKPLKGLVDEQRYQEVLKGLEYQAGHAQVWRDAVCNWFLKTSGIPDAKGRAGKFPGRTDAEAMKLEGYQAVDVRPWEAASGATAVRCAGQQCSASLRYDGASGWRDIYVQYFDQNNGTARFKLSIAGQLVAEWLADDTFPSNRIDAHSSTRRAVTGLALRPGDEIRIEGFPDRGEAAVLDYVEVRASQK